MSYYPDASNVIIYSDAPEVAIPIESDGGYKIPVPDNTLPEATHLVELDGSVEEMKPVAKPVQKFWQRKWVRITASIAILLMVALVVGLVVGLVTKGNGGSENQRGDTQNGTNHRNTTTKVNFCDDDKFCRSTLHATEFDNKIYLFARSTDNQTIFKTNNGSAWDKDWESLDAGGGAIISPPTAIGWKREESDELILGVVAVSLAKGVYHRALSNGTWEEWEYLNPNAGSQLSLCTLKDRMHIWSTDAGTHRLGMNHWVRQPDPNNSKWFDEDNDGKWNKDSFEANMATGIGLACREQASSPHDVAWYEDMNGQRFVRHQQWNEKTGNWQDEPSSKQGNFTGDPFLYFHQSNSEKVYFLGVQNNSQMYHYSWENNGYSDLVSLGGSIASSPSIVTIDGGITTDIFALGTNRTLQHLKYDGTKWEDEWLDLGVEGRSAPTAKVYNDEVFVFMIDENEETILLTFAVNGGKININEPKSTNLGGKVSNKGYYGQ